MLNVVYAEFHIQARYAEFHYAECHYAECHYSECRYAECYDASMCTMERKIMQKFGLLSSLLHTPYLTNSPVSTEIIIQRDKALSE
jgi:hypothetical protein